TPTNRDRRAGRERDEVHGQELQPLLPGRGVRVGRAAAEEPGELRQLHRMRRLLDRLPVRQHHVPLPARGLRGPVPAGLGIQAALGTIEPRAMSGYDVIIVGGGPAGLAAGLYTARMDLKAVLLDRGPLGGQLLNTELIEDYPGFESILGSELAVKMGDHARKFGLEIRDFEPVKEIDVEDGAKVVRLEAGGALRAPAVIMA